MQRQQTEQRILDYLEEVGKLVTSRWGEKIVKIRWEWVRSIHHGTKIEMKTLIKTLNRMVKEGKILERRGKNNTRLFCIADEVNVKIIKNQIKSKRKDELSANRYWLRQERKRKRNLFTWNPRKTILEAIIKIEEEGENETKVLDEIGISSRGYESWIKRSPRLAFIRKKIRVNKKNGKAMPEKWKNESPLWLKRYLINGDNIIRFLYMR